MENRPIVWILGAGFSRPLGGPLLSDLFAPWRLRQAAKFYIQKNYGQGGYLGNGIDPVDIVHEVFLENGPAKIRKEHLPWGDNPEDFLDMLDAAKGTKMTRFSIRS